MRRPREIRKGATYHVSARANRGIKILGNDKYKDVFLKIIARAKKKYIFLLKNFCIMDTHIHFIIEPGENQSLSRIMQWILSVFAMWYNKEIGSPGHVWWDRFKSKIIDDIIYFLRAFVYVANNPVKAKIVHDASDYLYNGIRFIKKKIFTLIEPLSDSLLAAIEVLLKNQKII